MNIRPEKRDRILKVFGYVLFVFWIVSTMIAFYQKDFSAVLWFCNFSVGILAIACFQKSLNLIYFFLAMGIFFQTPWILDWTYFLFNGKSIFGLVEFYSGQPLYFLVLTFIRHTISVPLSVFFLFLFQPKKPSRKSVLYWILFVFLFLVFSYIAGGEYNINCIHYFCAPALNGSLQGNFYSFGWAIFVIGVFWLSLNYIIFPVHKFLSRIEFVD